MTLGVEPPNFHFLMQCLTNQPPPPPCSGPPCSGQSFSTVRATVRGGQFLVKKTLSRALRSDPKPQNMFRIYTTN